MKNGKRLIALLLVMVLTISCLSLTAFAGTGGKSSDDAIAWAKNHAAAKSSLDYDGVYGAQCVDLIKYYYAYLGCYPASGNAEAYRNNALPSGWQRIQGATPQKGDILVYGPSSDNPYGHVAIYESDYSTYHQNFNNHSYVERVTYRYNGLSNPYWGVIRPDFSTGAITMAWTEVAANPSQTDARISAKLVPSVSGNFGQVGVTVYNALGNVVGAKKETADSSAHTYLKIWYDITSELGVTLAAGHTYKYQYYAYFNGVKYTSDVYSFTTTGTAAHTYGSWSVKVAATHGKEGVQARTCSICGAEETRAIPALALANVAITSVNAHITGNILYWDAVTGADLYQVYRLNGSSWELLTNTRSLAYKDTTAKVGVKHYYKIVARNGDSKSDIKTTKSTAVTRPALANVTINRTIAHSTGNILYWNAVNGADLYQVYRMVSGESSWTLLDNTRGLGYKDTTAKSGVRCYYKIVARSGAKMSNIATTASTLVIRP